MLGGLALCGVGCGPIQFLANVPFDAAGAIAEAKHMGADKTAPYEMTAAQEYLHKSRVLGGYARYHAAIEFARKASKLAGEAKELSRRSTDDERASGGGESRLREQRVEPTPGPAAKQREDR